MSEFTFRCADCHKPVKKEVNPSDDSSFGMVREINEMQRIVTRSCVCKLEDHDKTPVGVQMVGYSYGSCVWRITYDDESYEDGVYSGFIYEIRQLANVKRGRGDAKVNKYLKTEDGFNRVLVLIQNAKAKKEKKELTQDILDLLGSDVDLMKEVINFIVEKNHSKEVG